MRNKLTGSLCVAVGLTVALVAISAAQEASFRGKLGKGNDKIKREGDKTFVWAGPREHAPSSDKATWYDFTGAPFAPEELQFGIGMDSIPSIDDPMFVDADDPRLLKYIPRSRYRREERPTSNEEIPVIGFVQGEEARAYPIALLDRHELVNDTVGGKPVTVGW